MSTSTKLKKELKEHIDSVKTFRGTQQERDSKEFFEERRGQLKTYRKGKKGIESIWKAADDAYTPHTLKTSKGKKVLASDDELGLRSAQVILGKDEDWKEDSVAPNPYIKIQTAFGIIVDRNPTAIMNAGASKYQNNAPLMENLYTRSWEIAKSRSTLLKPLIFNATKYGLGVGRTYPLQIRRSVRELTDFVPEDPKKNKYKEIEHTYFDDAFRESLSPWQVWFDDASVVGNPFSINDVVYYKDYDWDKFKEQFGHLKNFTNVLPDKRVLSSDKELESFDEELHKGKVAKLQTRVWFYENLKRDMFYIQTDDGVVLLDEPMPQSAKNKKLSVWPVTWTLRNDKDLEGIGIYEAMRNDHKIFNKIKIMSVDQLVLSIYKEFFYAGTEKLDGDGMMKTKPGVGRQVVDPQNIKWNVVPGPGKEVVDWMKYEEEKMEEATGVTKQLEGTVTGKTAFETSQARESALKRMKTPLENITDGLEHDAYISIGIFEDLYSVPKIKLIAEDRFIEPVELEQLREEEIEVGEEFDESQIKEEFREFPLHLERKGEKGELEQTEDENFFTLKEEDFPWEGVIKIEGQSIIANSELLERTTTTEMTNMLVPLFQMPREIAEKPSKELVKAYNKDPADWLPDAWLQPVQPEKEGGNLFVDSEQAEEGVEQAPEGVPNIETVVPKDEVSGAGGGESIKKALSNL